MVKQWFYTSSSSICTRIRNNKIIGGSKNNNNIAIGALYNHPSPTTVPILRKRSLNILVDRICTGTNTNTNTNHRQQQQQQHQRTVVLSRFYNNNNNNQSNRLYHSFSNNRSFTWKDPSNSSTITKSLFRYHYYNQIILQPTILQVRTILSKIVL